MGFELSGSHLPERGAHGIDGLAVPGDRLVFDGFDDTSRDEQAQRIARPPVSGVGRHAGFAPVFRVEIRMDACGGLLYGEMHGVEAEFGVGFRIGGRHESQASLAVCQVVGEFRYGQSVGIGVRFGSGSGSGPSGNSYSGVSESLPHMLQVAETQAASSAKKTNLRFMVRLAVEVRFGSVC